MDEEEQDSTEDMFNDAIQEFHKRLRILHSPEAQAELSQAFEQASASSRDLAAMLNRYNSTELDSIIMYAAAIIAIRQHTDISRVLEAITESTPVGTRWGQMYHQFLQWVPEMKCDSDED